MSVLAELPGVRDRLPRPSPADKAVTQQVVRRVRCTVLGKVARGRHRDLAHIAAERHRDHVALDRLADADADVLTSAHEIDELIVHRDVEYDVGTGGMEGSQYGPDETIRGCPEAVHPDGAGWTASATTHSVESLIDAVEGGPQLIEQRRPRISRRHAPGGPMKQARAHTLLDPAHPLAQRGW